MSDKRIQAQRMIVSLLCGLVAAPIWFAMDWCLGLTHDYVLIGICFSAGFYAGCDSEMARRLNQRIA